MRIYIRRTHEAAALEAIKVLMLMIIGKKVGNEAITAQHKTTMSKSVVYTSKMHLELACPFEKS